MPIVIVEGVDGSGKTTLLRNLRKQTKKYFWIASSSGRPRTYAELNEAIFWIGQSTYLKLPIICDRYPLISEKVYGPVIRGTSLLDTLTPRQRSELTELMSDGIDRIIYCRPPVAQICANLQSTDDQMPGVVDNIEELIRLYDRTMTVLGETIPVLTYNYTNPGQDLDELFFGKVTRCG